MKRFSWRVAVCWLALVPLALLQGCQSGSTGADTRRYACTREDECASGFVCRAGMCQSEGGPVSPPEPLTRLVFLSPAQTVEAGQCSAAVVLEVQTAAGSAAPVESATNVLLSAQPAPGVGFFRDESCTAATDSVTVEAGSSRATFHFRGTVAPTVRIGAVASGFAFAEQDELVRAAAPVSVSFATSAQTLPMGGCSGKVELEARDAYANPASFSAQKSVTLTGSGLTFFSDPGCITPLSSLAFAAGATRSSFYFKGKSSGTFRVSAAVSGMITVRQDETLLPLVRMDVCKMPANSVSVTCPISPAQLDLSKTMLFVQASPTGSSPDSTSLRCMLTAKDAFVCGRNTTGSTVFIVWRTVELASGLKVQHLQPACQGGSTIAVPIEPVSPGKTFLLVSGEQSGKILGEDDYFTARLADAGNRVDLQFSANCSGSWKGSLQVVEADAIRVNRGSGAMSGTQTQAASIGQPAVDLATSALLFTYRVSNAGTASLCDRVLRGELSSPMEVSFSRGAGATSGCTTAVIDDISWERIDFGPLAQVQTLQVSMIRGEYESYPNISAVDDTRALVFASGQGMNGPSGGEASYSGDDAIGESLAGFEFYSPTGLQIIRDSAEGRVKWTSYVVQFEP